MVFLSFNTNCSINGIYNIHDNTFIFMKKTKTKEQILESKYSLNEEIQNKNRILEAMEEYSEQNCDFIHNLFNRPAQKLKPLEDLYRKENPHPTGIFYIPDRTKFYEWITHKILDKS